MGHCQDIQNVGMTRIDHLSEIEGAVVQIATVVLGFAFVRRRNV
jgi:hypothetical protein